MRLLLVEDEEKLAAVLAEGLRHEGYAVDVVHDGGKAYTRMSLHRTEYDLAILDLMLPTMDGLEICTRLRAEGVTLPILVLTARAEEEQKVNLLLAGADDYLVKPFSFEELTARIQAILRRPIRVAQVVLRGADITLDPATHTATRGEKTLTLTLKEFGLLEYFLRHPNEVVSRETLTQHLWDVNYEPSSNVVDVHVKNLRRKLDQDETPGVLETIRRAGYRLRA